MRAHELGPLLAEVIEKLNDALERAEDAFEERLGTEVTGRVVLKPRVHLVYREGCFDIERLQGKRPPQVQSLFETSKEIRILAAGAMVELFKVCGGQLPVKSP